MKKELFLIYLGLIFFAGLLPGQDCSIISKANDITPDRLCSPVTVEWEVSFRGVNNSGTSVKIRFEWDDGSVETYNAVNVNSDPAVREWAFKASHTYTSDDDLCNYHPEATLVVNGQLCSSSSQEQIVTVWDNDNSNGGKLNIKPQIYPICFGNGANARFQDNTRFNCVPPQENDVPNVSTRWIQWIYGTTITMTGQPVTINGNPQAFPYRGNVITLPGPVTGSGQFSDVINVANDKLIGQFFEVTLRYWNYCNPYDDPLIPGPPADVVNGDNDPMTTTARILIVPYPDATIDPVAPVCETGDSLYLNAADPGGKWSGNGITNATTGEFDPKTAGVGDHIIRYEITDGNKCSDWDTVVVSVRAGPDATITPISAQCNYHIPFMLESAASSGAWAGTGITDAVKGIFSPEIADTGSHLISFISDPDHNGCIGKDQLVIRVHRPPLAEFITEDSAWCMTEGEENTALIKISGTEDLNFSLVWKLNERDETIALIDNDTLEARLQLLPGMNTYRLMKITELFGDVSCERTIDDLLQLEIWPNPEMKLDIETDGFCSPVSAEITGSKGNMYRYSWMFGDGGSFTGDTSYVYHTYFNTSARDTSYTVKLTVENQYGCVGSIQKSLWVYPNPVADFLVYPQEQKYPETKVEIINFSGEGNWQYLWNFGDETISELKQPVEHIYDTYGEYEISLKTYSEYCSDSVLRKIRILPPPPVAAFSPDTAGCGPLTVEFRNESLYAETWLWDFDDGTYSNEKDPVHTFLQRKQYKVRLTVRGMNGLSETSRIINVYPDPVASFNAFPLSGTRTDQVFRFVNTSEGAVTYLWDFGDGETSSEMNPSYVYGKEGTFDVVLYAWTEYGCPDTVLNEKYIKVVEGKGNLVFPNAFRWNRSGPTGGYWTENVIDNTVFHPHFINVDEYNLIIYSRWGELLYESDDLYKGWDGYFNNAALAPQGVYVYKVWITYTDGRSEVKAGDVTFLH